MTEMGLSRIVKAMLEVKERRDAGERVHEILEEVAAEYSVPLNELKDRAEASWGTPLETDRERHLLHFTAVESAEEIAREARGFAKSVYEMNLPYVREHRWWQVNWEHEIDSALKRIELGDPFLERLARQEFLDAATHFENIIKKTRNSHA